MAKIYWYLNNNYLKGQNYPHTFNDPLGIHFTPPSHTFFSTTQFLSLKFHRIPPSMSSLVLYLYLLFESKTLSDSTTSSTRPHQATTHPKP